MHTFFVFVLVVSTAVAQECPNFETSAEYKAFGTKTTLEQSRKLASKSEWTLPDKYEPVMVYGFIRHGTRYPDADDIVALQKYLSDKIVPLLDKCTPSKKSALDNFMAIVKEDDNRISDSGVVELEALAGRFAKRLPSLFTSQNGANVGISEKSRTAETAKSFFDGLSKSTGQTFSYSAATNPVTSYHDNCENNLIKYGGQVDDSAKKAALKLFKKRTDVQQMVSALGARLGYEVKFKDVKKLYKGCAFSVALFDAYAPLCKLFTVQELELMDYLSDIDDYYGDTYGAPPMKRKAACVVVKEFVETLDQLLAGDANSQIPVQLRFSHAGAMKPLVAHLGLFKDKKPLDVANGSPSAARQWHSSLASPFAANVFFVVLVKKDKIKDKKGRQTFDEDDLVVATLVQERLVKLDGACDDDKYCKLKDFKKRLSKSKCELKKICSN